MSIFEKATRAKLRFKSLVGAANLSVEDLWDLPLDSVSRPSLQSVARATNADLKASSEEDFISAPTSGNKLDELRMEIVKHVIQVRQEENQTSKTAAERKAKKDRLIELLAQKQDQELAGKSPEEIQKLIAELE